MTPRVRVLYAFCLLQCSFITVLAAPPAHLLHLIEIDPGHSHLSGLHSQALPGVSDDVHIYSPLTAELATHLATLSSFNARAEDSTHWAVQLFAGPSYLKDFEKEPAGQIVALSGRNEKKIDYILEALRGGQNVFADKPWIITGSDFPKLQTALHLAEQKKLVAYDWMTLRGNRAYQLQRDLVQRVEVFGQPTIGSDIHPAVRLQNLHALLKFSKGAPQLRPPSFLDFRQQGEGMADVGTHLADLVQWTLFPQKAISFEADIKMLSAQHSSLLVTREQFARLTGLTEIPEYLKPEMVHDQLRFLANGSCLYTLRGVHVQLKVQWQFEAPKDAGDSYLAVYEGTRSIVELRAGAKEHYLPEIYVIPVPGTEVAEFEATLRRIVTGLRQKYSGLSLEKTGESFHVVLPPEERAADDLHEIFKQFAAYVHDRSTFPEAENANLLAKYYVTTAAVAMANAHP